MRHKPTTWRYVSSVRKKNLLRFLVGESLSYISSWSFRIHSQRFESITEEEIVKEKVRLRHLTVLSQISHCFNLYLPFGTFIVNDLFLSTRKTSVREKWVGKGSPEKMCPIGYDLFCLYGWVDKAFPGWMLCLDTLRLTRWGFPFFEYFFSLLFLGRKFDRRFNTLNELNGSYES